MALAGGESIDVRIEDCLRQAKALLHMSRLVFNRRREMRRHGWRSPRRLGILVADQAAQFRRSTAVTLAPVQTGGPGAGIQVGDEPHEKTLA